MQEQLLEIYRNYPWASQDTADRISSATSSAPQTRMKISALFAASASSVAFKSLLNSFKQEEQAQDKELDATKTLQRTLKSATNSVVSKNVDGLGSIASLVEAVTEAASELSLGDKVSGFIDGAAKSGNKYIRGISSFGSSAVRLAGSTAGVVAGVGSFAAVFINAQDKLIKSMIDLGFASSDMGEMQLLRSNAARLGMGFDEYSKVLQISADLTATSHDSAVKGALEFGSMANRVAKDESISKFGMRTSDLTFALSSIADSLYKSNQINNLNPQAQQKIIDVFTTTNEIALGLAVSTGENRATLLSELDQQRQNISLNTSFRIAGEEYINKFGEEAYGNLTESTRLYLASIATMFGRDSAVYIELEKTFQSAAYDINHDQTIVNNMTPELVQLLNEVGGGFLQTFIDQGNDILEGKTTQRQALVNSSKLLAIASNQAETNRRKFSIDPITQAANELMSTAQVANAKLKNISLSDLKTLIDSSKSAVDVADDQINTVDKLAIAFTMSLDAILPNIDTLDATLDAAFWAGETALAVMDFVKTVLGFDSSGASMDDIKKDMDAVSVKDIVLYTPDSEEYKQLPSGMQNPLTGNITAKSINTYQNVTRNMLPEGAIRGTSMDNLQQRVQQMQKTLQEIDERVEDTSKNSPQKIAQLRHAERLIDEQLERVTAELVRLEQDAALGE